MLWTPSMCTCRYSGWVSSFCSWRSALSSSSRSSARGRRRSRGTTSIKRWLNNWHPGNSSTATVCKKRCTNSTTYAGGSKPSKKRCGKLSERKRLRTHHVRQERGQCRKHGQQHHTHQHRRDHRRHTFEDGLDGYIPRHPFHVVHTDAERRCQRADVDGHDHNDPEPDAIKAQLRHNGIRNGQRQNHEGKAFHKTAQDEQRQQN